MMQHICGTILWPFGTRDPITIGIAKTARVGILKTNMGTLRGYLTIEELETLANITVTDEDEAYDQISFAEELIDEYVGYQDQHIPVGQHHQGVVTSVSTTTIFDISDNSPLKLSSSGYFAGSIIKIIGGPGAGESRRIVSSEDGSVTVESAFTTTPTSDSTYVIIQLAKFPRRQDIYFEDTTDSYYRTIPEAVKKAVAAQISYMIEMGDEFFIGGGADMSSESIGNYSYQNGGGGTPQSATVRLISPKARTLLRGIMNRKGRLEV